MLDYQQSLPHYPNSGFGFKSNYLRSLVVCNDTDGERIIVKDQMQTRPRPLHMFLLISAIGLLAMAFVATTGRRYI